MTKVLINCDYDKYINPITKRCVQLKNPTIQKLLKQNYKLDNSHIKPKPTIVKPKPTIVKPKPKSDADKKIEIISCGKDKIINPFTNRCVSISGPTGKKVMALVQVDKPKIDKPIIDKPKIDKPIIDKPDLIKLDKNQDNYISINEYLDAKQSLGPKEIPSGLFFSYQQPGIGIGFLLTLIAEKGPVSHIACIPNFYLCFYKIKYIENGITKYKFYTLENDKNHCPLPSASNANLSNANLSNVISNEFVHGHKQFSRASIRIMNTPYSVDNYNDNDKMTILIPPNLKSTLDKCVRDKKYMVICSLSLKFGDDITANVHANTIIFDTKNKIIERFDPHGGSVYLGEEFEKLGRKDFKFGDIKHKSNALADQEYIDSKLKKKFKKILPEYTYMDTNDTCPYLGPQIKADAYTGLCGTWTTMYMLLRVLNPHLKPADITSRMIEGTRNDIVNKLLRFQKFIINKLKKSQTKIYD
jgi:hypothetical protein